MTKPEKDLTHLDAGGRVRMVDVGGKAETRREAVAEGRAEMRPATLAKVLSGENPKGDVLAVARLAGIAAAKRTSDFVPLCHPVRLTSVGVEIAADGDAALRVRAVARAFDRTGVEMEALAAVAGALLAVYDMVKAVDRDVTLTGIRLLSKSGGASGDWVREGA